MKKAETPFFLREVQQRPITIESIQACLTSRLRRYKLSQEWPNLLHAPLEAGRDWSVVLPFEETFANAFRAGCPVNTVGLRRGKNDRCYTFLPGVADDSGALAQIVDWSQTIGRFVGMRDCLALSFALDYDRMDGNPTQEHSAVGLLRVRAKPYDQAPTMDTYDAAGELACHLLDFVVDVQPYSTADAVVATPPSNPDIEFCLPRYLARELAQCMGQEDLSDSIRTIAARPPLKAEALSAKVAALAGTIDVDQGVFDGKTVLLVDDLYQSGATMNYAAMLLLNAGAERIFGLSCVKTCRNDDNMGGRP